MKPRRKHSGLLSGMVKYPQEKHRKGKPPSLLKRIGAWIVGTVVVLAVAAFIVTLFWGLFHPEAGTPDSGDFIVDELVVNPPGYPPEERVAAAAFIRIRGRRVPIQMTESNRAGVEVGSTLHVDYTWLPKYQQIKVTDWKLAPAKTPDPPAAPAAPSAPSGS